MSRKERNEAKQCFKKVNLRVHVSEFLSLLNAEYDPTMWIDYILCIHSPDGHLACFHLLATVEGFGF